ncbi:MAG: sensor histidine kinase, partial [Thermoleophilaceae bacterium]
MIARLNRDLIDPRTYTRIAYLLLAGVLGIVEFTFLVTILSLGVGLAITLVGIPILIGCVYAWGWLAELERRAISALTGNPIASPYRPLPERGWWERLRARLADPATWKDLTFLFLQFPFGLLSLIVTATVLSFGVASLTLPLWYWAIPDGVDWALFGLVKVDSLAEALAFVPLGAVVLYLGIPALGALGRFYGYYAELLLGSNEDPALTAEMSDLRDARTRIIEAADAERRRIERDLHDGAQQRLVALSLNLRMAEKRAAEGDPAAAELVRSAGEEAGLALKELRDLARGIHPAMLTNRGLTAALDDLAGRAAVPVEVVAVPSKRLPDQVESAAYFLVSECLANVGKHAQATRATVAVTVVGDELEVVVKDDGVGGAELGNGSGLQGLEDRVGALDG